MMNAELTAAANNMIDAVLSYAVIGAEMDEASATQAMMMFMRTVPAEKREAMASLLPEMFAFAARETAKALA